jgi:hypothetical protein
MLPQESVLHNSSGTESENIWIKDYLYITTLSCTKLKFSCSQKGYNIKGE